MSLILAILTAAFFLAADQITKYIVITNMELGQSIDFIDGLLDFTYIHNNGGAWGIFGGSRWFLIGFTAVIMLVLLILLIKNGKKNTLFLWAGSLILSGGIGNLIDRIFRDGKVIDFLHATFINFPIFNVADCAVVIGAGLLILYFILDMKNDAKRVEK
ncbi:MAG: signal peptidase II [Clostridia bacterium]|nr:signal peptidase II [Clostridia bacterium]